MEFIFRLALITYLEKYVSDQHIKMSATIYDLSEELIETEIFPFLHKYDLINLVKSGVSKVSEELVENYLRHNQSKFLKNYFN